MKVRKYESKWKVLDDLAEDFMSGDEIAFDEIYKILYTYFINCNIRLYNHTEDDAMMIAADSLVYIWENLKKKTYDKSKSSFHIYCYKSMRWFSMLKHVSNNRKKYIPLNKKLFLDSTWYLDDNDSGLELIDALSHTDKDGFSDEICMRLDLEDFLTKLTGVNKEVFRLTFIEKLNMCEISEEIGISKQLVYLRLLFIRDMLERWLK